MPEPINEGAPFWPGDVISGRFKVIRQVAYMGNAECVSPICRRSWPITPGCLGWHCSLCDAPCSSFGHGKSCPRADDVQDEVSDV